jgi:hypothetical protein
MSADLNPYAPPLADLESGSADGPGFWRDGELLRMGIGVRLPDRCIRCNESAGGRRYERSFYRRPLWWRWVAGVSLSLALLVSLGGIDPRAMTVFWLVLLGLGLVDSFVRRKIDVGYGLCRRHHRMRAGLRGGFFATWILLIGFAAGGLSGFHAVEHWWFWALAVAMLLLAIAASMIYRFTLARAEAEQIWLRGTGRPFLNSLPAVNE